MTLGIDTTNLGSGGAQRHIIEIMSNVNINNGFDKIIIWGNKNILSVISNNVLIEKKSNSFFKIELFNKIYWFLFSSFYYKKARINILFVPAGTYIGIFRPYVVMCRNMLIFDNDQQKLFGLSFLFFKFRLLNLLQRYSFSKSEAVIFISNYAKDTVNKYFTNAKFKNIIINHGVNNSFRKEISLSNNFDNSLKEIKVLYVSPIWPYKHHVTVIKAINFLYKKGYRIKIDFVGRSEHRPTEIVVNKLLDSIDNSTNFISFHKNVTLNEVNSFYHKADIFVFASSCENMPNILIEAMASGIPIVCSSAQPMSEFLKDAGLYFNPTDEFDLVDKIEVLINDKKLRDKLSNASYALSEFYSWEKCSKNTFNYLNQICNEFV
jgi:glycosyltransferase involved in cell wall biosynthesis